MMLRDLHNALRPGAAALLSIAKANDTHGALARNSALWIALEGVVDLRRVVVSSHSLSTFTDERSADRMPECFLELVTFVLIELRRRQASLSSRSDLGLVFISDFDIYAFQAVGNALADTCWPERTGEDFSGPEWKRCKARLSEITDEALGWRVVQHYLGGILQSYFDQAEVRRQVRDLPAETERELREIDALNLVNVGRGLSDPHGPTPQMIWRAFGQLWDDIRQIV